MLSTSLKHYLSTTSANTLKASIVALSVAALTACGGGSGDSDPTNVAPTETKPLDHLTDLDLQRSASSGSKQMQSGVNNAQSFATQPALSDSISSTAGMFDVEQLLGMSEDDSSEMDMGMDMENGSFDDEENVDYSVSIWDDTGVDGLIDITLGLVGNADITRDGNSMLIDPDDNELCQHDMFGMDQDIDGQMSGQMDEQADFSEMQFCLDMMSDLTVRIDGQTEDSGDISYLFQDETVMQIEYAANQTLFKLRLPGVARVFDKAYSLDPDEFGSLPEVFEGVIEWGSRVENSAVGSEAGSMSIAITAPIVVQDSVAGFNLRIAAADLLSFEHDNANGTASVAVDARAFLLSLTDEQSFELASGGGSVQIDLINDGDQISVSKLGLGNGPLTLTIDSVEVINMTLDTFGFDIDTMAQQLVLTDNMNLNLMVNFIDELFGDSGSGETLSLEAAVSAPQNALFSGQSNGSVRLDNAGPFSIDWFFNVSGETSGSSFVVSPGECFTEDTTGNALFSQVVCD